MLKKTQIIENLTTQKWVFDTCLRISKNKELARELYQYFFLLLLEKDDAYVEKLHNDGYLQWWAIKVLHTAINGNRHPFQQNRIYDSVDVYECNLQSDDKDHLVEEEDYEQERSKIRAYDFIIESSHWYERELFKMWLDGNSARSLHRKTGISVREILRVVKLMKQLVQEQYEKTHPNEVRR